MTADVKLLDLLTRLQEAGEPIDMAHGDDDARIPAPLWREFVDAHAELLRRSREAPQRVYTEPKEYWKAMAEWLKTQPRAGWDTGPQPGDPEPL